MVRDLLTVIGTRVSEPKSLKDLGVSVDSQLNFREHIDYINSKAIKTIEFLRIFTSDCNVILHLYRTLVMPILIYVSPVWSSHYDVDIDRLEKTQHNFIQFLSFKCSHCMEPFLHEY